MGKSDKQIDESAKEINDAVGDECGCAEAWESLWEFRNQSAGADDD